MKEYYDIYYYNGEEWKLSARFPIVDDRVHFSIVQEIEKIQGNGFKFKYEYVEEKQS